MSTLNCRVRIDSDLRIYVISGRTDNLKDGHYIIDSRNEIYVVYLGYYLSITAKAGEPVGRVFRIEASNNENLKLNKLTSGFVKYIHMHKVYKQFKQYRDKRIYYFNPVKITIRKSTDYPKVNNAGEIIVRYAR